MKFNSLDMHKVLKLSILAVAVLCLGSCNRYQSVPNDPLDTKMYTLDNGLKVYMTVNKEKPRIQTYIAVKVGGKNDPSETTGLAHYFEHLMFKGTQQFGTKDYEAEKPMLDQIEQLFETYRQTKDEAERAAIYHQIDSISYEASKLAIPNEYDKLMAMIGADGTNAWTSQDETVYTEDIPSNQIDNWARIQADRFKNNVIRGFHTELETIYEEKNMSLTKDSRKVYEALDAALFPNHPYGKQTVLGTQEHLKNPSITNVKKYHDTYYVPNNIAICLSGDFNPDQMIKTIEKYFGDWQPNPEIPALDYQPEKPIETPIIKDVYGLEAENVVIGWRLPGETDLKNSATASVAGGILYNGMAGLIDLDLNQEQKTLSSYGYFSNQPDYCTFMLAGNPKEGQTLEEVRDLLLAEAAKLGSGDFDEALIPAVVNDYKLSVMKSLEDNSSRARYYVDAFISGIDWKDKVAELDRLAAVTKDDIVAWANEFIKDNNYAIIYKRKGVDNSVIKVSAPAITPIVTNRDCQSDFLTEIQNTVVKPVEPKFVDFKKDMVQDKALDGVNLLYKKNGLNDIAQIVYIYNTGVQDNPVLSPATNYIQYLGTDNMTAQEIAVKMYSLACSFNISSSSTTTQVSITGLSENIKEAAAIVEDLIANAKADENILANVKADIFKSRANAKANQSRCYSALASYSYFGPEYIKSSTLSNAAVSSLTSEELLSAVKNLGKVGHEALYYGPASVQEIKQVIAETHPVPENSEIPEESFIPMMQTPENTVALAQYDAKQVYYLQYSNRGDVFDVANYPELSLYNEYFGGGMNTIVFQEMREARGLAYSAWAQVTYPSSAEDTYCYRAFIATQNDKVQQAVEAFADIINNMPQSEAAFSVAKEGLISRLRTDRTTGIDVLWSYRRCRRMGIDKPADEDIYNKVQGMTLQDVVETQTKWAKDLKYTYNILGDIKDLDMDYIKTLGPVTILSLEDIFGY